MTEKSKLVYRAVSFIPQGKVITYKSLARLIGVKNPRVVGNILHKNPDPENTPCHRVVNKKGQVAQNYAFGGVDSQIVRLKEEGISFENGKVKLDSHLWQPPRLLFIYFRLLSRFVRI